MRTCGITSADSRPEGRFEATFELPFTGPVGLMAQGALIEGGWLRSFREARSVDQFGDPVPWYTYSCTHILGQRLEGGMRVAFEFGSGLSTFWYAARARAVVAVEHDEGWAGSIGAQLPPNASIILEPEEDGYVAAIDDCGFST